MTTATETCPFIRVNEVAERTGLSVREVWRKSSSEAGFPRPRKLSTRKTVWVREQVEAWIAEKLEQ